AVYVHGLCARPSVGGALFDVIGDAIVAAQNDRTIQAHQLFGFLIEGAVFISLCIQREKSFDAEVTTSQKFFVHLGAVTIKLVHQSSPFTLALALSLSCSVAMYHNAASCQNQPFAGAATEPGNRHIDHWAI